ncbi:MAG: phosphodiester glycosidase family protein [Verrucomicrobia bacterium]|nr:phosphodiester glycosidase family protein [Verrucomicrobiota bacterium]
MKTLFLLFLLSPGWLYADWKVIQRRDSVTSKGEAAASELTVGDGASRAEVQLIYFRPADIRLEAVTNLDRKVQGVQDAVDSHGGFAGINGGYFEANLDPLGLLISNNRVMHPVQKAKLLSGIFFVRSGQPELTRTREFAGIKGVQQAIQCGPFLVEGGRVVPGLNDLRVAPRTFVFTSGASLWGFGICRSATLREMGEILAQAKVLPEHPIIRALNFDGGSSTAFYVRLEGRVIFSEGRSVISNYLIVRPKN